MASEFLEILSEGALEELKQVEALVKSLATDIKNINSFKASNTPSGADKNIKGMTDAYKQQGDSIEKVRKNLQKLSDAEKDAASKKKASMNAMWDSYEKGKNKEKELSDKQTAREIENAEKEAKAEIEKNNKITQSAQKRAEKEAEIEAKKNKRIDELRQAQEVKWKRTGASSVIPGMSSKIAEIKESERLAKINEHLSRSYVQLTNDKTKAKNKLQDLIASQTASRLEIRNAQKEYDGYSRRLAQADKAVGKLSETTRNYRVVQNSVSNLMAALGISTGLYLAFDVAKSVYNTTKELQSLDLALKMVSGSSQEFASNKGFISEISEKWGLDIKKVSDQFVKFYADAKGKLSGEEIEQTFEGIGKAGSVMGLSLEKQQSAFTAFQQMLSKGTIQAQELKLQLGDALPGSIKVATAAYQKLHPELKVTEALLYKHMEQGKVISAEMIPEMVKGYQKLYGIENIESINTMASAQNRVKNAWTEWVRELSSGNEATSKTVSLMNFLANNLKTIINVFVKGGTILGVYLGVTKALNFAIRQSVLITEAYAIAKSVLTKRTAENTVAENINTASKVGQTGATVALTGATEGATVATNVFNAALLKNPIVAVIALVMAGVTAYLLLRDSTDDATTALIKYEQAKRDAEKTASKTVKGISKKEDNLRGQLELEQKELLKLQDIQRTATKNDLKDVADRVKAKKEEIEIIKERLRLEGVVVGKTKTQVSQNAYKSANKAEAERNALELKKLKKEEELQKVRDTSGNTSQVAKGKLTKERDLLKSISELEKQIRSKNVEIIKNNKIFNDLRVKNTKDTNAEEIKNIEWYDKKIEELEAKKSKFIKRGEGVEYQRQLKKLQDQRAYILGEEPKANKSQIKLEKDQAKEREQILKEQYEAELSNLEKRKEALSNYLENEKNFNKEEISAFKFGTDQKMKYALKLAQAEINIAELVHKEKTRIAKKDALDRNLNPAQTKNLLIPIDADLQKSKQDAILKGANTFTKTYSEYYKELSKNAETEADAFQKAMDKYKMTDEQKKALEESEKLREKASEDVKNYIASFQTELGQNLGFDETANFFLKMDEDGRTMYDKLNSMADGSKEKQIATFQAIAEAAQETFNFIANASQENFDAEYSRLEKQKETALQFAGESDAAKKKIEEDYENRRKEIAKREFKAKQKIALVNIAIDTAQAVAATIGKTGFFGIPLATIVAALGAVQLGIVASQKVPEYWKGTGNALEGLALTQERGAEIITDKKGVVKDFGDSQGARLTMMEAGDKVYTAEQTKRMMFNKDLNNIMMDNGIGNAPKIVVNNTGVTKAELQEVMMSTLGSMPKQSIDFDGNKFNMSIKKGHSKTMEHQARITGMGLKIGR